MTSPGISLTPRDDLQPESWRALVRSRLIALALLLLLAFGGALLSTAADRGFADVHVSTLKVMTSENVPMVVKVNRPASATAETPAPGLLALHGYQSDKEATTLFGATELARRGFVVMSFDHFGHGDSTELGVSPKIMSGAEDAFEALKALGFVNPEALGVFGHSTGAVYAVRLAEAHPEIGAVVALSGNGSDEAIPGLRNYLLVQGSAEEIPPYREATFPVTELDRNSARVEAFGRSAEGVVAWNTTYGSFEDGSARRAELVPATHLGVMIAPQSNSIVVDWFTSSFTGELGSADAIPAGNLVYYWKEIGGAVTAFALLLSLVPLLDLLLLVRPLRREAVIGEGTWQGPRRAGLATLAVVNIAVTMVLYPVFTQWGGGTDPIATAIPFLPLEMGNGVMLWLFASTIVGLISYAVWRRGQGKGQTAVSLGLAREGSSVWRGVGGGLAVAGLLIVWLAAVTSLLRWLGLGEVRAIWPLLRGLTTQRALYLLPYFLIIAAFFIVINALTMWVMARIPAEGRSDLKLWALRAGYAAVALVSGLLILLLIQFVPLFVISSPGLDLLGLPQFSGRWSMMLWVIIPQFLILIAVSTWVQVRTRSIWAGAFLGAMLFTWFVVGSQVGRF